MIWRSGIVLLFYLFQILFRKEIDSEPLKLRDRSRNKQKNSSRFPGEFSKCIIDVSNMLYSSPQKRKNSLYIVLVFKFFSAHLCILIDQQS